jgi:hypothetical protein
MSHAATFPGDQPTSRAGVSPLVPALLVVWVGLVFGFGATGAFVVATGTPPLRLFAAVAGPVVAFLILDLIVAVTVASAVPMLFPNGAGAISTAAMARLPLVLIPGFFVPGFLILHLIALAQARRAASATPSR